MTSTYSTFLAIPYVNTGSIPLGTTSAAAFKGDICRYLSGQPGIPDGDWVMPTLADFYSASRSNWTGIVPNSTYWYRQPQSGGFLIPADNALTAAYPDGAYHGWNWGASYSQNGTVLPASGYRNFNDGTLGNTGNIGRYWSSRVSNASFATYLDFFSSNVHTDSANRGFCFSVRCVLQH
jgi:hypothetical protein